MWKKAKASLTLRIFVITSAMLVAACAITYGAIAYLTPLTYTSLLEDELAQQSGALIEALGESTPGEAPALLDDFARRTGTELLLVDAGGVVLYGQTAVEATAIQEEAVTLESGGEGAPQNAEAVSAEAYLATESAGETLVEESVQTAVTEDRDRAQSFAFADGTWATLTITGGLRAVNQAAEALGRVFPFLIAIVLLISLAGSFFYARFITRPIVSMSRIARRMATLDFDARWTQKRSDEMGVLGESLNLLADNLSGALLRLEEANQALRRDIDRERELEAQRRAFFSAASHELKTPITILKGQLSGMLARVGIYQDREKYLARALVVTGRMEDLVKEILTLNRIESGGFTLQTIPVDLSALMEEQLELDAELMEQKGLLLEKSIESGVTVRGDAALLARVLDNVLLNAILYSPEGAAVRVGVREGSFTVENTGVSIAEEALGQLFMPFYRVEQSRNRKSGGSGLGLYLVKSILDLHGADCAIENTPEGVRFCACFHE